MDSLEVMCEVGGPVILRRVRNMVALGVGMDESMSSAAAVKYRVWRAIWEFGSNRSYYTSRDVRLKDKFDKYAKQIVLGLLYGAAGWTWSVELFDSIRGAEGNMLVRQAKIRKSK